RAPKNAAREADYYQTDEAEGTLSELESIVAPVLHKVRQRLPISEGEESWNLATFVAMMMARVPALHDNLQGFFSELLNKSFWDDVPSVNRGPETARRFEEGVPRGDGQV